MAPAFRPGTVDAANPVPVALPARTAAPLGHPHFRRCPVLRPRVPGRGAGIGSPGPGAPQGSRRGRSRARAVSRLPLSPPCRWSRPAVVRSGRTAPAPALEAAPFSQVSRECRSRIISRERARPPLSAARAGRWRSGRTSASPRAARRAPRRKCEGRRGTGGRCPGAPGWASRRRDAGDAGRMAAAARPERGRCCHGVSGRGAGGAGAAAGIRRGRFYCSPA